MTDKMREAFEAAYVEGLVDRCGEGFRSTAMHSLTEKRTDGEYLSYPNFIAWWAWQASREALVIELPDPLLGALRYQHTEAAFSHKEGIDECRTAIEAAGVKVTP